MLHVARRFTLDKGQDAAKQLSEIEVAELTGPLVLLGEPGLGKTDSARAFAALTGAAYVTATVLLASKKIDHLSNLAVKTVVVDGLDEASARHGGSVVAEVLGRLIEIGSPRFVLACRAADWLGAGDQHHILGFYGERARTLHLEPFSRAEALSFLAAMYPQLDADECLRTLSQNNLSDLSGNPLTLMLVGKVASKNGGLPHTRSELFKQGTNILVQEVNPGHLTAAKQVLPDEDLLDAAGACCATLLLSGSAGIWTGLGHATPDGYLQLSNLAKLPDSPALYDAVKTRLFKPDGEGKLVPLHRVIAEFLGARWLAKRFEHGASERRLLQLFHSHGGVPTALRGLHAWLAYFVPAIAQRVIDGDPYGVLRYGEPEQLNDADAAYLIRGLAKLAEEDPYFRSEDWGSVIQGIARISLKDDILNLITGSDRHFHLSSMLLSSLPGSELLGALTPELISILTSEDHYFAERHRAMEALRTSTVAIDWPGLISKLAQSSTSDSQRLVLDLIGEIEAEGVDAATIANAYLRYHGLLQSTDSQRDRVAGMGWLLAKKLPSHRAPEVLDEIAKVVTPVLKKSHWEAQYELSSLVRRLVVATTESGITVAPERFWTWARMLSESRYGGDSKDDAPTLPGDYRREVQWAALNDPEIDDRPHMVLFQYLPGTRLNIAVSPGDAIAHIQRLNEKALSDESDVELWLNLVRMSVDAKDSSAERTAAIQAGIQRHAGFAKVWEDLQRPPEKDWEKEWAANERKRERARQARYERDRASLLPLVDGMRSASPLGALINPAKAYLGRFSDFSHINCPQGRLEAWLGEDIAAAALEGFVAYLTGEKVLTADQIITTHVKLKEWEVEAIMKAGGREILRRGRSLAELAPEVRTALLASWWFASERGDGDDDSIDIGPALEALVFDEPQAAESFLKLVIEPQLAANATHITGLDRLSSDSRFASYTNHLALTWLETFPNLRMETQTRLLALALRGPWPGRLQTLVDARAGFSADATDLQTLWSSAAFLISFTEYAAQLEAFAKAKPPFLFSLRSLANEDGFSRVAKHPLRPEQLAFIISVYGPIWPPVPTPSGTRGTMNSWDASDYVQSCINALSADPSPTAARCLDSLVRAGGPYLEALKHAAMSQRRAARDLEYDPPTVSAISEALSDGTPSTIDDLKALVLDRLDIVEKYIRDAPTDGWRAFWGGAKPLDENTCRDRLADALTPRLQAFGVFPESLMPEEKRSDLLVASSTLALPIEIKGQWHKDVWHAHLTQLDDKYARHYQAQGRGIYIVLWFGAVSGKNLPPNPKGLSKPSTPEALKEMMLAELNHSERARIDVVVLDVSQGKISKAKLA